VALLSVVFLGELVSVILIIASIIMALGCWLAAK
jgi:drug/metabolite transporter (DMT)-like permease